MGRWQRWQDWLIAVVAAAVLLSPVWTVPSGAAAASLVVLGGLLLASAVWSLVKPASRVSEWVHMVLGALLVFTPWVIGYSGEPWAAWTSWIAGAVAIILGAAALPSATTARR